MLYDKDVYEIRDFIISLRNSSINNFIIDLRRNPGGDVRVVEKLFSSIASEDYKIEISRKVQSAGNLDFRNHTFNYSGIGDNMYADYTPIEGKEGYYLSEGQLPIFQADSNAYEGNVFVLVDERSYSASSVFAGLVHRYKRGVIIGRETGSLFHRLNASDYARLNLSNTKIEVRIPLVQSVYEWSEGSDIPWGRGVLPDYPLPITYQERFQENDVFLDKALQIVKDYKPKMVVTKSKKKTMNWGFIAFGISMIVFFCFLRVRKTKKEVQ